MAKKKQKKTIAEEAAKNILGPNPVIGLNKSSIINSFKRLAFNSITKPTKTLKHQLNFFKELTDIVTNKSELAPSIHDKRFKDVAWQENVFLKNSLQVYLGAVKELDDWIQDLELEEIDADRSKFVVSLFTEALAPSNWMINPSALKHAVETGGKSWVRGFNNLLNDLVLNGGMPSKVDTDGFKVVENLGISEGAVVHKTELIEMIQYVPTTKKVYRRPILIVPPQINKFYIADLAPGRSLIEFLLNQGYQVFIISWRNPTKKQRMWDLETYVSGIEGCITAAKDICNIKSINVWGACSGGITLSTTLAYLAAKNDTSINAASFVVSMLDVSGVQDTPAGLFADKESIELAREKSHREGVLKGKDMAIAFSWMRPNDLIWNYWVNNYLHGNKPPKYDVLYWNDDTTNLPASLHSDFLDMFNENYLTKDGAITINDRPIDLKKVNCDMYFVAGQTDHITPWKICYESIKIFQTNSTFILGNKGHIQTILNPPGNTKGKFYCNEKADCLKIDSEEWMSDAIEQEGSWWFHFAKWLKTRSDKQKNAPKKLGNKNYKPLYEAPGQYVFNQ